MKTSDLLNIPVAMVPDRTAIVFEDKRYTYTELAERVDRLAAAMAKLGVQAGDRVAIMAVNCSQFVEVLFATSKLAAVCVPLNYRSRPEEIEFLINSSEPVILFIGGRYVGMVDVLKHVLPSVKHYVAIEAPAHGYLFYDDIMAAADPSAAPDNPAEDTDTCILMYTAGTTGFPKGVLLSNDSFVQFSLANVATPDLDTLDVNLVVVPMYHVAALQGVIAGVYGGRTLVIQRQFVAEDWMKAIQDEKVTSTVVVPTMLKMAIDYPDFGKYDISSLHQLTYGAAPMPFEVIKKAIEMLPGVRFVNAFGQTETAATITALGPEDHDIPADLPEEIKQKKLLRLERSIGRALADTEVKIFGEESGEELPMGQTGELWARGARTMSGYWKLPEQTAQTKTAAGWVRTGDLGWVDDEGYIYLAGRAKDLIIRGGENISPEEVENVLYAHPAVDEAAVIGVPDVEWGERIRGIVVLKKGMTATAQEVMDFTRDKIAAYKRPESIVFVDELPRNPLGKILKRVLRDDYGK